MVIVWLESATNVELLVLLPLATPAPTSWTVSPGRLTPGPNNCTLLGDVAHVPAVACVDST